MAEVDAKELHRARFWVVPDQPLEPLNDDEAITAAKKAFNEAKWAQALMVSDYMLMRALYQPDQTVTYNRLQFMRDQARAQVDRAQVVADALTRASDALDAARTR